MNKVGHFRAASVAVAASVALFASLVSAGMGTVSTAARADDSTEKLAMSIETSASLSGTGPKVLEYWSGESIVPVVSFAASGTDVNISHATLELCFPKSTFIEKPAFVDSAQATSSTKRETDSDWCIDYFFKVIRGGTETSVPAPFKFIDEKTPNGTTQKVTWKLKAEDGSVIKAAEETFTAKAASSYTPHKTNAWGWSRYKTVNGVKVVEKDFQIYNESQDRRTPANGMYASYFLYAKPVTAENAPNGKGLYKPGAIKFVDILPPEATLAPSSIQRGWIYDPATHTASWQGAAGYDGSTGGYTQYIDLLFNNVEVYADAQKTQQKIYDNRAVITIDPGTPNEKVLDEVSQKAVFNPYLVRPTGGGGIDKYVERGDFTYFGHHYYWNSLNPSVAADPEDEERDDFRWALDFGNTNNQIAPGGGPVIPGSGIKTSYLSIRDFNLDSRLYYNTFTVTDWLDKKTSNSPISNEDAYAQFNAIDNVLYGIQEDGTKVELGRNLKIRDRVVIKDTARRYSGLQLDFATPLELDNVAYRLRVTAYPLPSETAKWEAGGYPRYLYQKYQNFTDAKIRVSGKTYVNTPEEEDLTANKVYADTLNEGYTHNNTIYIAAVWPRMQMFSGSGNSPSDWGGSQVVTYENCESKTVNGERLTSQTITPDNCGRVRNYHVSSNVSGNWGVFNDSVKNLRQLVILPPGVTYLRTTKTRMYGEFVNVKEPTIIQNFKNTGRTALLYSFGDVDAKNGKGDWNTLGFQSWFDLDTTLYAESSPRKNRLESYTLWDNNDFIVAKGDWNGGEYVDALDIDGDGNKAERFLSSYIDIEFFPPLELVGKKTVSLDGQAWTLDAPAQDLGGDIYYRYTLSNSGLKAVSDVSVIDVLPHTSDHKIAPNEDNIYLPRTWNKTQEDGSLLPVNHSAFTTPLTGPLDELPANTQPQTTITNDQNVALSANDVFDYFYSTTLQGADTASVVNSTWLTKDQITNWEDVKNVKIVMKPGLLIPSKASIDVVTHNKIPYTASMRSMDADQGAVNSIALSRNGVNYLEANEVTAHNTKYSVDGIVFKDFDKNGNARADETRIANRKLALMKEDPEHPGSWIVATQPDGTPIVAVTDAKGHYFLNVYPRGTYKVRFLLENQELPTTAGNGAVDVANHAIHQGNGEDVWAGTNPGTPGVDYIETDPFTLEPTNRHETRNAGVVVVKRDLPVHKVDQDGEPISGINFTLHWVAPLGGQPDPDQIPADETLTTNEAGEVTFTERPFGQYTLTEGEVPEGIEGLKAPREITLSADPLEEKDGQPLPYLTVENRRIKADVTVVKKDAADPSRTLAGAVFELYRKGADGTVAADAQPAATSSETGTDGVATFSDVLYGDYELREKTAPANYFRSAETRDVKVRQHQVTVEAGTFTNRLVEGSVLVKKTGEQKDPSAPQVPLAGVGFSLYAKGADGNVATTASYTAQTDNNGIATFTKVPYGTYVVKESAPLPAYNGSTETEGREVSIATEGQEINLTDAPFTNTMKRGTVKLTKVDADNTAVTLQGVTFALYEKTNGVASTTAFATALTDANGVATFSDIPYGTYEARETASLINYVKNEAWTRDVTINAQGQIVDLETVTNQIIKGSVTVEKRDTDSRRPLPGVTFALTQNGAVKYEATTDASGVAAFGGVIYGDYTLEERATLESHVAATAPVAKVAIRTHGQHESYQATNTVKKGRVTVTKVQTEDPSKKLEGAVFTLTPVNAPFAPEALSYTATSDVQGAVTFENVRWGTYQLRETTAPVGHVADATVRDVVVSNDGQTVAMGEVKNRLIRSTIALTKRDALSAKPLPGAAFELREKTLNADGTWNVRPVEEAVSDANGQLAFANVPYGMYEVAEKTAPAGYLLSEDVRAAVVMTDGETIDLKEWDNVPMRGSVVVTKVNGENGMVLPGAVFEICIPDGPLPGADAASGSSFAGVNAGSASGSATAAASPSPSATSATAAPTAPTAAPTASAVPSPTVNVTASAAPSASASPTPGATASPAADEPKFTCEPVSRATTDASGHATFANLPLGHYLVREVTPAEGFNPTAEYREATVSADGETVDVGIIENTPIRADVRAVKVNQSGSPLAGAVFELTNDATGERLRATSTATGDVLFEKVLYGQWTLREVAAPEGYLLDTASRAVSVSEQGVTVELGSLVNRAKPVLAITGATPNALALALMLSLTGGLLLVERRKQRV